jgi:7,8-dihydropterin-6-yl-methyl-4-(beta-D-ribofuranosyl)aminobenzene 5'-phosphate synthase
VTASEEAGVAEVRIVNLYDAFGKNNSDVTFDFGFSAYVEYRGTRILFDAGTDAEILRQNARALGVDLTEIDYAVASHSHADHISGFEHLLEVNPDVRIYFPNDFFGGAAPLRFSVRGTDSRAAEDIPADMRYFGGGVDEVEIHPSGRFWKANVDYVDSTVVVAPGVTLISTRSPFIGTFSRYPNLGFTGEPTSSEISYRGLPELSMMLDTEHGAVLLVGCSHSTVEAIVQESIAVTGGAVALVMGGYHLLPYTEEELTDLAKRLKNELGVTQVAPAHCTGHLAFKVLMSAYGNEFIRAGLGSEIRF